MVGSLWGGYFGVTCLPAPERAPYCGAPCAIALPVICKSLLPSVSVEELLGRCDRRGTCLFHLHYQLLPDAIVSIEVPRLMCVSVCACVLASRGGSNKCCCSEERKSRVYCSSSQGAQRSE
eukprot:126565-Prorocentrum_minimum.AAC.2